MTPPVVAESELPTVDLDGLKAEWRDAGIIDHMPELVNTFIEESSLELSLMVDAYGRKDLPAIATIAHKMKSGAAALRVYRLVRLLQTIEAAALGPPDSNADLQQLLVAALREWDTVRKVFEEAREGLDERK
jgi:HPt (histidine-containing phosphotransfer) domain-containing protein